MQRLEGGALFNFGGRFALSGSVSQFSPIEGADAPTSLAIRAEIGARAGRVWFTTGTLRRDTTFLPAAIAFDTAFRSANQGPSNGIFATMRGKFYRDVGLDVTATRYDAATRKLTTSRAIPAGSFDAISRPGSDARTLANGPS